MMSSSGGLLIWLAALSAPCYLVISLAGDLKARPVAYFCLHATLFILYLGAVLAVPKDPGGPKEPGGWWIIFCAALAFRLILLPATPTLSDDIYRYIWEGGLQLEGINPYRHAPSDPELASHRDRIYEGINYKELPAIYPPFMQWTFALGSLLGRSPAGMKAIFIAADMALILVLTRLLRARGMADGRAIIYAWNPLAVVEVAGSGHNDSLPVCFLVASTLGIIGQRQVLSMTALGLSVLSKLFPLALLPLFARKVRPALLLLPPMLVAVCYLPYLAAGESLVRSPREYAERWRSNDSLFAVVVNAVEVSGVSPPAKTWADARGLPSLYTQPHMIARGLALLIILGVLAWLVWRQRRGGLDLERAIFLTTATVLLLQPVLHPWYLIWILPWLALYPSPAWLALSGLVPLAYLEGGWVWWVEYLPFFALLAIGAIRRAGRREGRSRMVELRPERRLMR